MKTHQCEPWVEFQESRTTWATWATCGSSPDELTVASTFGPVPSPRPPVRRTKQDSNQKKKR